jgi:hypothetical protein
MLVDKRALAILASAALALHPTPDRAEASDRPALAADIERTFDQFFLFTTSGNGRYVVYQQVEDPLGIPASSDVICMLRECLLPIAELPESVLADAGRRNIGRVRESFRAVRDAYRMMRAAAPAERPATIAAWHGASDHLRLCLDNPERC